LDYGQNATVVLMKIGIKKMQKSNINLLAGGKD